MQAQLIMHGVGLQGPLKQGGSDGIYSGGPKRSWPNFRYIWDDFRVLFGCSTGPDLCKELQGLLFKQSRTSPSSINNQSVLLVTQSFKKSFASTLNSRSRKFQYFEMFLEDSFTLVLAFPLPLAHLELYHLGCVFVKPKWTIN